jgi:hypothetical protein
MAFISKIAPKQEKKHVAVRLDEETHRMLQRYAAFIGNGSHECITVASLKRLFQKDREFKEWLEKNHDTSPGNGQQVDKMHLDTKAKVA